MQIMVPFAVSNGQNKSEIKRLKLEDIYNYSA